MKKKTSSQFYPKPPQPASVRSTTTPNNESVHPVSNGFLNTIKEGFAFGIGSSIARQAVNSVFSSSTPPPEKPIKKEYQTILEECDFMKDMYKKCIERTDGNCVKIMKDFNEKCGILSEYKDCRYILGYK